MFYKENIKIIPCNLENHLTLLALAVFFLNSSLNLGKKARLAYIFPVNIQDLWTVYFLASILVRPWGSSLGSGRMINIRAVHRGSTILATKLNCAVDACRGRRGRRG